MIHIGGRTFALLKEHKNGWNAEAFRERYSDVLDRYDYVVGDWGYNQLRLKGFYKNEHNKATKDSTIHSLQDYLQEYCNFGCAFFIVERILTAADLERVHSPEDEDADQAAISEMTLSSPAPLGVSPHLKGRDRYREREVKDRGRGKEAASDKDAQEGKEGTAPAREQRPPREPFAKRDQNRRDGHHRDSSRHQGKDGHRSFHSNDQKGYAAKDKDRPARDTNQSRDAQSKDKFRRDRDGQAKPKNNPEQQQHRKPYPKQQTNKEDGKPAVDNQQTQQDAGAPKESRPPRHRGKNHRKYRGGSNPSERNASKPAAPPTVVQ